MSETVTSKVRAGQVIAGTYRLTRLLGKGGMGAVWEAEHERLPGEQYAIKVLSVDRDQESLARFDREAKIASRFHHPNIVEIHDHNVLPDHTPYLVLELLRGESLESRIARGPIPENEAVEIVRDVCLALRLAHREGVVHRDLKPQNIFLCKGRHGRPGVTKVLDFGISKIRGSTTVKTQTETVLGTPQYMSPEQAKGDHDKLDARTDIFSLGIVAYEMLTGNPPFTGQNIPEVVFKIVYEPEQRLDEHQSTLAAKTVDAVHRALSKAQEDRFANVDEFVVALGLPALEDEPADDVPEGKVRTHEATADTHISDRRDVDSLGATLDSGSALREELAAVASDPFASQAAVPARTKVAAESIDTIQNPSRKRRPFVVAVLVSLVLGALTTAALTLVLGSSNDDETKEAKRPPRVRKQRKAAPPDPDPPQRLAAVTPSADAGGASEASGTQSPDAGIAVEALPARGGAPASDGEKRKATTEHGRGPKDDKPVRTQSDKVEAAPASAEADATAAPDVAATPVAPPLPSPARLKTLPPLAAENLRNSIASFRDGQYAKAARQARTAHQNGGGERAMAMRVVAYCAAGNQQYAAAPFRQLRQPRIRRRVKRYCAGQQVTVGD